MAVQAGFFAGPPGSCGGVRFAISGGGRYGVSSSRRSPAARQRRRPVLPLPRPSQRIAKLLARAGIASRREVERMIAEGRIAIAGRTVETPATLLESLHGVTVDGKPVRSPDPARLFRFHKPAGLLTTERDPKGRPTIYDRLPKDLPRLMPVGRLDMNTEGLLLLTTDGGLKRQLELPATGVERIYRARAFGTVTQERLEALIEGVEIEGVRYGPIDANLERRTGRNQWIELKLTEGKNREVRRVLEHLGLKVSRLIRTAYGPFDLGDLPAGAVEEVRQHDLVEFRRSLDGPSGAAGIATRSRLGAPKTQRQRPSLQRPAAEGSATAARSPGKSPNRPGGPERTDRDRDRSRAAKPVGKRGKPDSRAKRTITPPSGAPRSHEPAPPGTRPAPPSSDRRPPRRRRKPGPDRS